MDNPIPRRRFLSAAVLMAALPGRLNHALTANAQTPNMPASNAIPIIDCHIHLFDPTRPQGVPWPTANNAILYKPALPARYREVIKGFNVVGAIEIECSTWLEDNQWVLDVADKDTIMVGTVGNLEPGKPEFAKQLERFHKNPLFRGIRYGNLWNRNLGAELAKPEFVADLKLLTEAGLVLDTASPTPQLLADVVRVTDLIPSLRIVIDHLPNLARPESGAARSMYDTSMKQLSQRPQVYVKVSEVLQRGTDEKVAYDLASYRPKLDEMYETFGQDRLLYGSDWPNSDPLGTYEQVLNIVREYFTAKGRDVAEKYFWRNSVQAYRWVKRDPNQPA
jgi:predicted TIM-barrel fold metal-dependent hydrolase